MRSSSDTEMGTSGALMDSVDLVTMLAGSREQASLPARHGVEASGVAGHAGPPTSSGGVTLPGSGPPDSLSAGTATHLPARSHPPGEFYRCEIPHLLCPAHGRSTAGGLGTIPTPAARNSELWKKSRPRKAEFF